MHTSASRLSPPIGMSLSQDKISNDLDCKHKQTQRPALPLMLSYKSQLQITQGDTSSNQSSKRHYSWSTMPDAGSTTETNDDGRAGRKPSRSHFDKGYKAPKGNLIRGVGGWAGENRLHEQTGDKLSLKCSDVLDCKARTEPQQ